MPTEEELIQERVKKRQNIIDLGINPYPHKYQPEHYSGDLKEKYAGLKEEEHTEDQVKVAGRLMAIRRMGKASFAKLQDHSGYIQLYLRLDNIGEDPYKFLKQCDIGDWIGAEGKIFKTKTGEVTVEVNSFDMLCKALRPLPEKWHGLTDIEQRYRQRYVDLVMNPDVRETFKKRTQIIDGIREFLNEKDFLEVDTPVLQPIYGGGAAKPFTSHLNALDMPVYLRISNELYLKRLIVGGFPKVYEFSRDFRNEDIDRTHNPEFTVMECYEAYTDFNDMMKLTENLYEYVCKKVNGSTKVNYEGHEIDFKAPWEVLSMTESLNKHAGFDPHDMKDEELYEKVRENRIEVEGELTRGKAIQLLFEELVEDKLIQPTFIIHHPEESTPLCKKSRDRDGFVERFEPFCMGMEIGNAYTELNDPVLQRELLEKQAHQLRKGEEEAHPMDEDFVRAIEVGMPPTGGLGIGVDRMVMLLTGNPSIRDVLFFPFMKVKQDGKKEDNEKSE